MICGNWGIWKTNQQILYNREEKKLENKHFSLGKMIIYWLFSSPSNNFVIRNSIFDSKQFTWSVFLFTRYLVFFFVLVRRNISKYQIFARRSLCMHYCCFSFCFSFFLYIGIQLNNWLLHIISIKSKWRIVFFSFSSF